ncbi:hypothetical protein VTK73DRAFT_706 [Phialemonium thermophilum]|uniref:Uncharacterized protein n=1 Tax=Phialemonium thermophilum TaxID=223376 RepID=A0ABR3VUE2_9PEZI
MDQFKTGASRMASANADMPQIGQNELASFHERHFSAAAVQHFQLHFMPGWDGYRETLSCEEPQGEYDYQEDYEDDGLGYYHDGVKRTLTDEQIEIFRHSELHALQRAWERGEIPEGPLALSPEQQKKGTTDTKSTTEVSSQEEPDGEPSSSRAGWVNTKKKKKRKKKKGKSREWPEKPDLRKRTWDVVDAGLESLDYGDDEAPQPSGAQHISSRRRISYDE